MVWKLSRSVGGREVNESHDNTIKSFYHELREEYDVQ